MSHQIKHDRNAYQDDLPDESNSSCGLFIVAVALCFIFGAILIALKWVAGL